MLAVGAGRDFKNDHAFVLVPGRFWWLSGWAGWSLLLSPIGEGGSVLAGVKADGAAVVTHTERFWQTLAAHPSDAAPAATAAVIEMLFRQDLLRQPISIDDPAEGASWDVVGRRALLVVRIEGSPRQPMRLVWYATRPATLSPYADLAEAFAHHASLALEAVMERDNLNRAVTARHRVGLAQGILMNRRQLTADQAFTLLKRQSQNTNVKLRTIAQTVIQTGDLRLERSVRPDDTTFRNRP